MTTETNPNPEPAADAAPVDAPADGATDEVALPDTPEGGSLLGGDAPAPDAPEGESKPEGEGAAPEIKFDAAALKAPEGFAALDTEALTAAAPLLAELGVDTDEKAQATVEKFAPIMAGMVERATTAQRDAFTAQVVEQRRVWGEESRALFPNEEAMGREMAHAARFIDGFGGPDLRQLLNETGLGDHPVLVKTLTAAGKQLGDGEFIRSDQAAPERRTLEQKFYGPEFQPKA